MQRYTFRSGLISHLKTHTDAGDEPLYPSHPEGSSPEPSREYQAVAARNAQRVSTELLFELMNDEPKSESDNETECAYTGRRFVFITY